LKHNSNELNRAKNELIGPTFGFQEGTQMSIRGDMVAGTAGHLKLGQDLVKKVIAQALEEARDPNFAHRYAAQHLEEFGHPSYATQKVGGSDMSTRNDKMLDYWNVIQFLVDHL
jgi:hypothetical protein